MGKQLDNSCLFRLLCWNKTQNFMSLGTKINQHFTLNFWNYSIYCSSISYSFMFLPHQCLTFHKFIANLAHVTIVATISSLSTNFQIGFGSFVDKSVGPYSSLDPAIQQNPCRSIAPGCVPTYSYRHVLSLTENASIFNVSKPVYQFVFSVFFINLLLSQ